MPKWVPKVHVHDELEMAFWVTLRVGSRSTRGLVKRAGFRMNRTGAPAHYMHLAMVRDPYERYIASMFVAWKGQRGDIPTWEEFCAWADDRNSKGDFYTFNGDRHFHHQWEFREGMTDPMELIPLETSGRLNDLIHEPRHGLTHVNQTDPELKRTARKILDARPIQEYYAKDREIWLEALGAAQAAEAP